VTDRRREFVQWREIPGKLSWSENDSAAERRTAIFRGSVYRGILAHTVVDSSVECAGLLLGRQTSEADKGHPATLIEGFHPLATVSASATHFTMRADAWPHLWRRLLPSDQDPEIVGWYHSHPGHGVFLSGTDRATQAAWFRLPWHIALVVDPLRQEAAAFSGPEGLASLMVMQPDTDEEEQTNGA
jgi:proteasome lid subunit RPN8/RPN11